MLSAVEIARDLQAAGQDAASAVCDRLRSCMDQAAGEAARLVREEGLAPGEAVRIASRACLRIALGSKVPNMAGMGDPVVVPAAMMAGGSILTAAGAMMNFLMA